MYSAIFYATGEKSKKWNKESMRAAPKAVEDVEVFLKLLVSTESPKLHCTLGLVVV